uniref:Acetyl coenzyme A carboxylase 1 n=1 Tax=Echinococcus granulosus TaxID=6210 RepID=A0A068WKH7_ECHGR|nr:acetyl coenzyme A carboxylase 1 [Echinococcus granulosus]
MRNRANKKSGAKKTIDDNLPASEASSPKTDPEPQSQANRKMSFLSPEEFVRAHHGQRCIKRILVANNGIAAVKCMRSIRSWAYMTFRNAEAFFFVCMASPEDVHASAEYIKMANKMVMVPGGSNVNNYANVELILQTAITNHVDAVWAGWGHASENPQLPEVLAKHNIAFLGPSHEAMWALGDKIASTILAQSAGIPTVPWSGSHIIVNIENLEKPALTEPTMTAGPPNLLLVSQVISANNFENACVKTAEQCQTVADRIGYPVMIKASEGGGGKGIRRVSRAEDVAALFNQVQSEVPESPIFVMKCVEQVRHLEVQLLADQYGEAISLYGRDCSVQRRHQKILEEAPCVVAPKAVFDAMERDAIHLAKLVGYSSAGTVEYLYNPETQEYFFLELNPRLQVEHPCTEVISGVNLPACQLQIAMGLPLIQIKYIRQLFGLSQSSDYSMSLSNNLHLRNPPSSHVIAVRITSEDPDEGFKPHSGDVFELNFKSSRSVWGYFSVGTVGGIHEFADSQFGHCFSAEASREEARENMVLALRELLIRGDFRTTVEYLIKILESDAYTRNEIDTAWLDRLIAQKDRPDKPDVLLGVMCTALHIGYNALEKANKTFHAHVERGQFIPTNELSNIVDVTLIADGIKYVLQVIRTGKTSFHLITNGGLQSVELLRMSGDGLLINHESSSYMTYCQEDAQGYRTVIDNRTVVFSKECDPSILRSPSTGKLVQYIVGDGCHVFENEVYALVEVMKLVLELRTPASGVLFHLRSVGAILETGAPIGRLQLDDPQQCQNLELFTGQLIPVHATEGAADTYSSSDFMVPSISSLSYGPFSDEGVFSGFDATTSLVSASPQSHGFAATTGSAVHRTFTRCLRELEEALLGYVLPEPFFSDWLKPKLDELFQCLRDPNLPLFELEDLIAQLSGRLPIAVEQSLRSIAASYSNQLTSVLTNFPSERILRVIEAGAPKRPAVTDASIAAYKELTSRLVDLARRFEGGVRGHASLVLVNLLAAYVAVEQHYQHGQYDRCVTLLFARQKESAGGSSSSGGSGGSSDIASAPDSLTRFSGCARLSEWVQCLVDPTSVDDVVAVHFSHHQLAAKNALVCGLIERSARLREELLPRLSSDLFDSLTALTQLGQAENAKVALTARKFLISAQSPPYELRRNQVESIILSAISTFGDSNTTTETLQRLITSETSVFDVLLEFFYHQKPAVVIAALEVYVRRAYITYELTGLQHALITPSSDKATSAHAIFFRFLLPNASMQIKIWKRAMNAQSSQVPLRHSIESASPPHYYLGADEDTDNDLFEPSAEEYVDDDAPTTTSKQFPLNANCWFIPETQAPDCIRSSTEVSHQTASTGSNGVQRTFSVSVIPSQVATASSEDIRMQEMQSRERLGAIVVFNSFEELKTYFPTFLFRFEQKQKAMLMERRAGGRRQGSFPSSLSCRNSVVTFQDPPFQTASNDEEPVNVMNVGLRWSPEGQEESSEEATVRMLEAFCQEQCGHLKSVAVRRITFMLITLGKYPLFFNFRARDNFKEDRVYRNLEPALAFQMEINRLQNYDLEPIPVLNRRMQMYIGKAKVPQGQGAVDFRFFVRSVIRHADLVSKASSFEYLRSEAERTLLEAMDALEMAFSHPKANLTTGNHIFLNFAPTLLLEDIALLQSTVRSTILRYATRLIKLRVKQAELKLLIRHSKNGPRIPIRLIISNEQGYSLVLELYREVPNPRTGAIHLVSFGPRIGSLHGCLANAPHQTKDFLQIKRFQAQKYSSTYVYDYPVVFGQVLNEMWNSLGGRPMAAAAAAKSNEPDKSGRDADSSSHLLECKELCLNSAGELVHVDRPPCLNKIGMVVWYIVMRTPEYPEGRPLIVIANDVTHNAGSFGPCEDLVFYRASELARRLGIPRIFLAANTGARIRLAEEVKAVFRIAWADEKHPQMGFNYLYLTPEDYEKLKKINSVNCERVMENGEERYKIVDIIGKDFDISVENLRGSALIAEETARAYEECFTLSVVTSRTIGIGAYLVRLGQRVIQIENSHIILTGAMALNKLLGRQVYTGNGQLGGVQVMANNGVCHLVVPDEYLALQQVVHWLSFVPISRGARLPVFRSPPADPIDRPVEYVPSRERTNDDPRWMFTGVMSGQLQSSSTSKSATTKSSDSAALPVSRMDQTWLSGFFDRGTWQEALSAWAPGVIVGRARLGGIPCGVVTPETRVSVCRVPADPANPASEVQTINQAGQVWYPDSSYKTAQAIADFAREELPLFIFANWRGFSGGLKDMYDQVLKFGAMIVESLRTYPNPVFIYLPPHAELRGGAWVVIDPAINPDHMEFFCTPRTCRGGVIEPEGTVEIKYRAADLLATMNRLDELCTHLIAEVAAAKAASPQSFTVVKELQDRLKQRQEHLMPIYQQVSHHFADLHDTPGRLVTRGLVHGSVEWGSSRAFFFARLARRILEQEAVERLWRAHNPTLSIRSKTGFAQGLCESLQPSEEFLANAERPQFTLPTVYEKPSGTTFAGASAASSGGSTATRGETEPLLTTAERACQLIAEIGARRGVPIRQALTHLRQWFLEDTRSGAKTTTISEGGSGKTAEEAVEAGELTWEQCDVTVARWLAGQLGDTRMAEALQGLRDLHFDPSTAVWGMTEQVVEEEVTEDSTAVPSSTLSFLPRLAGIAKEQLVSHITRLLDQYPGCIDDALDCIQTLRSTHFASSSTLVDSQVSSFSTTTADGDSRP